MTTFFHDQQRDILVYQIQHQTALLQAIPEAKQVNGHYLALPRNLRNLQILRYLNYDVPPIITDDRYEWPRAPSLTPYASQKLAANFMVLNRRCFNLSDMGVGKTLATLWGADWLMRQFPEGTCRALIVAPLSTLQRVWGDAIFKNFLRNRTFEILHGDAGKRLSLLKKKADFYIINYEGVGIGAHTRRKFELDGFSRELAEREDIKIAIIDEASAYKEATTRRHRIARKVFGDKPYLWMLTGTPTPNAPIDAYGLAKLVNNAFGKSFGGFRSETMTQVSPHVWRPMKDGYEKARRLLTPSIRFDIKEVWDAPEMTTQQREVSLTDEQKKLMLQLKQTLQVSLQKGEEISAANEVGARTKFIQISLGAIYDEDHGAHSIDARPRISELKELLEQAPGKVLLFVPLTSVVNLLYKELSKRWSCAVVNGDVTQKKRSDIFSAFQDTPDGDPRILIADPGVMSHGLDLWQARTTIWYGPTEKTELYLQANKRAHRPGQMYPVSVVQIVSNALEREIFRRLETNTSLQGALLDAIRNGEL